MDRWCVHPQGGAGRRLAAGWRGNVKGVPGVSPASRYVQRERPPGQQRSGAHFAPTIFGNEAGREGCTKTQLDRAMSTLFARKDITNQSYGTKSRGLSRIVRPD